MVDFHEVVIYVKLHLTDNELLFFEILEEALETDILILSYVEEFYSTSRNLAIPLQELSSFNFG